MSKITDLQYKYDNYGTNTDSNGTNPSASGNTIIQQQINYITNLRDYIDTLKTGITNGNIDLGKDINDHNLCIPSGSEFCRAFGLKSGLLDSTYINFQNGFNLSEDYKLEDRYNEIMTNNKKIQDLRNELDLKLKDLNHTSDSRFQNYEDSYNYEVMMNITWSILAISIIYYVFVRL